MHSVHYCIFVVTIIYFQVLFTVHVKKLHTCTYHNIGRCGEYMYIMRSVDVMTICMYHMTTMCCVVNLFGLAQSCKLADRNYLSLSAW